MTCGSVALSSVGRSASVIALMALFVLTSQPGIPPAEAQVSLTVRLNDFSFEPSIIVAQPGEEVSVLLINDGLVDHTFTIFAEPNADLPLDNNEALQAHYQQAELVVDVRLSPGESGWANFTAPSTEANYILVCMIPGHAVLGMHGVLRVGNPQGPGPGLDLQIGIVQAIMLVALVGTVVFSVAYHLRTRRPGE